MKLIIPLVTLAFISCGQTPEPLPSSPQKPNIKLQSYIQKHQNDTMESISLGSVSNGSLKHGKLVPFSGPNFEYFDETSYLSGRAFLNHKVLKTMLDGYKELSMVHPERKFKIMECAHQHGGKLWPHRTHQNGLSVDFMMPKLKNNQPYYGLDSLGTNHYWLTFTNDGKYQKDPSISIDFELIAQHILILNEKAKQHSLKVEKVIIKVELKDELFSGKFGKQLKESGIYVVKSLTPTVNELHDEHYHIDFKEINNISK